MSVVSWICIIGLLTLVFGYFYRQRFYPLNRQLFDYLEQSEFTEVVSTIGVSCKSFGAWDWTLYKLFSDGTAIILTDQFELDFNRDSKLYARTYLLVKPSFLKHYPKDLFRHVFTVTETSIGKNGGLILKGDIYTQVFFRSLGWAPHSGFTMKIRERKPTVDWKELIR